jgi:glycerol-3-phosphate acyltransferase PlsY
MDFCASLTGFVIGSYLFGSIPFGLIIAKQARGLDIRTVGSGNIGAANVAREVGTAWGLATLVADALKGFLPVVLCATLLERSMGFHEPLQAMVGFAAVLGHQFPIYRPGRGGKGVATALRVFLGICPICCLFAAAVFLALVAAARYVSLGSILAALSMPMWLSLGAHSDLLVITSIAISLLIVLRHRDNIWRLAKGNEIKWHFRHDHDRRSTNRSSSSGE